MRVGPGLPGLPTFSALLLTAIFAIWLGVSGPIHFSALKDWQPLLAACIALLAAGVAYRGAMAKVEFDRRVHDDFEARQRSGLYMRLQFPLQSLIQRAKKLEQQVGWNWRRSQVTITKEDIRLEAPAELEEAWRDLHAFPVSIARDLAQIRTSLRDLHLFLEALPDDAKWIIATGYDSNRSGQLVQTEKVAKTVFEAASRVEKWLENALSV